MMQPLVSVIIPSYNHSQFIQECIESVINQDYENIELIIIDDGSPDDSVQKIEALRKQCEERFTRFEFRHRPNKGLCATLNEALDWVQGEFTASVGSDDVWVKEKTSIQVKYLQEHPETVVVFGNITLINDRSEIMTDNYYSHFKRHSFNEIFLHLFYIPTPTNLSRTKELKSTNGYDENLIIEDWMMWLTLAKTGLYLDCLEENLAYYRRHDNNTSSKVEIMHQGRVETIKNFRNHKLYKRALKNAYYIAMNEHGSLSLNFVIKALQDIPSFLFSIKFWKKISKKNTSKQD